jgi:anti-sigma-K factor RskA
MPQRYNDQDPDSIDDALDELLCEYVDGTMDSDVRIVFEEYLATDPQLAEHVSRLCDTRNMLCQFGACKCASPGLQAQLRVRLAGELARKNRSSLIISHRLGNMAFLTSVAGMMLIVSMMAGFVTAVQHKNTDSSESLSSSLADPEYDPDFMAILDDTNTSPEQSVRLESLEEVNHSAFLGPVTALPVVAITGNMTPSARRIGFSDLP